ncbi:hypothetical protein ACFYTS_26015 [Nocardia sp. NPDC004151]|uniref:hypothetical protein n=1 Tax=Nocardia sp. NPDC004151 TaxID=3364304 RepID=UPI0036B0E059
MTESLNKFSWMKAFAYNGQKMPAAAVVVIWHHANSETLEWAVSYGDMAHASGYKDEAMENQVKKLVATGWLKVVQRGGRGRKTKYRLAVPEGFDWSRCTQNRERLSERDGGVQPPNWGTVTPQVGGVDTPLYRDNQSPTEIDLDREIDGGVSTPIAGHGLNRNSAADVLATSTVTAGAANYRWIKRSDAPTLPDTNGADWNPYNTRQEKIAHLVRHVLDECQGLDAYDTETQLRQSFEMLSKSNISDLSEHLTLVKE